MKNPTTLEALRAMATVEPLELARLAEEFLTRAAVAESALASSRARVIEECAKVLCYLCRRDVPLVERFDPSEERPRLMHQSSPGEMDECHAQPVRALATRRSEEPS